MTAPLSVMTASDQLLCRIAGIGDLFAIEGEFVTGKEIPSGHINTTYKATYRKSDGTEDSYILQRINDYVFKDPKAVMRNVEKVTRHINWKVLRRLKIPPAKPSTSTRPGEDATTLTSPATASGAVTTTWPARTPTTWWKTLARPTRQDLPLGPSRI